jgi:hypothetical protein
MASVPDETPPSTPSTDCDSSDDEESILRMRRRLRRRLTPEEEEIAAEELQAHEDYLRMLGEEYEQPG